MIKNITFSFQFDTETDEVTNVTTIVDGVEKKKKASTKKPKAEVTLEDEALIVLEESKLVFNNKAVSDMGLKHEDRISIRYEKVPNKPNLPIISIGEDGVGNKLSKTNTVPYRGTQNTILSEYGSEFSIEVHREGIWKLVSKNPSKITKPAASFEEAITLAENTDVDLLVEDDDNNEINPISFTITI